MPCCCSAFTCGMYLTRSQDRSSVSTKTMFGCAGEGRAPVVAGDGSGRDGGVFEHPVTHSRAASITSAPATSGRRLERGKSDSSSGLTDNYYYRSHTATAVITAVVPGAS